MTLRCGRLAINGPNEVRARAIDVAGATEPAEVNDGLAGSPLNIALIWTVTAPVDAVPTTLPADAATRDDCG